jgi:thiol-disulfide isomerase/thioredoxin
MTTAPPLELFEFEDQSERPIAIDEARQLPVRVKVNSRVTADELEALSGLNVVSVYLLGKKVTGDEIRLVTESFKALEELRVPRGGGFDDEVCRTLARNSLELDSLWVYMSRVGDEGAAALATLPRLRRLTLQNARLTDAGLFALGQARSLEALNVQGNYLIQGAGLEGFVEHPALASLALSGTQVDDTDVAFISGCRNLMAISLTSTKVTPECLRALPQNLMALVSLPDGLDAKAVDAMRAQCPNLVIDGVRFSDMRGLASAEDGELKIPPKLQRDVPTLALFSATWCAPCKWMKTELGFVRANLREQFRVVEIDIEDDPGSAAAMRVQTLPTSVFLRNGREVLRVTGAVRAATLTDMMETVLAGA